MKNTFISNRLYWKISATLLLLLVLLGVVYVFVSAYTTQNFFHEVNQRLYGDVAEHIVQETQPIKGGEPDTAATHDIMHSMMVINPSVEVYLLNTEGKIIDYVVPYKEVKMEKVNLEPVKKFIETEGQIYVEGDDPKEPGVCNVFSAAPVYENDELVGYAYIILAGQEHKEVESMLLGSYFVQYGTWVFVAALLASLLVGLVAIWLITRNLMSIIETVRRFKEGDHKARIPQAETNDLAILSTTFNDMADTIEANIEELRSVENLRRELIANVSHDLRTPLAIMQGYVETLLIKNETLGAEDRKKYLDIVLGSSEKLQHLIAQLFEYSKLEAKQIQPKKEAFFLGELAQDVFQKYGLLAKEKNVELKLDIPENLPLVFADLGLVERVIQNLMDNALKFTPAGGSVTIALAAQAESVEVRIADTGPGIPEQEQAAMFDRYRQVKGSKKKSKGAGLGLAIAKKILELHESTIRVQSKLNEGTAFMFQLPVATV